MVRMRAAAGLVVLWAGLARGNSTAYWLGRRTALTQAIFNQSTLPTRNIPDYMATTNTSGLQMLTWDISGRFFPLNSTTFYYPARPGTQADCMMIHHHGHAQTCDNVPWGCGARPWDFYNVTDFIHTTLGCDYIMLYMPLLAYNEQHGYPTSHQWFAQWEAKGDYTIRYFLEPVALSVNYAVKLGYKHIYMMGKSGGGWTTTLAAALDPRISASFPIAGSVPLQLKVPPYKAKDDGDYEQKPEPNPDSGGVPWYLDECNYTCSYVLAGLDPQRYSVQILHENDPCCYAAGGRHNLLMSYDANVTREIQSRPPPYGEFTTAVTDWNVHAVCPMDKVVIHTALTRIVAADAVHSMPNFTGIPCDMLRSGGVKCPIPPASPPTPPPPSPPPPIPTHGGCWRGATAPCVYVTPQCDAAKPSQQWIAREINDDATVKNAVTLYIQHKADTLCLQPRPSQRNGLTATHTMLMLQPLNISDPAQHFTYSSSDFTIGHGGSFLNVGVSHNGTFDELQLYSGDYRSPRGDTNNPTKSGTVPDNEMFFFWADGTLRSKVGNYTSCVDVCQAGEAACTPP